MTRFINWLVGLLEQFGIGGDKIVAWIRTVSPAVAGWLIALAVTQFPNLANALDSLSPNWRIVVIGVSASILTGVYYAIARWAEGKWPNIGRWLLGSTKQPSYGSSELTPAALTVYNATVPGTPGRFAAERLLIELDI